MVPLSSQVMVNLPMDNQGTGLHHRDHTVNLVMDNPRHKVQYARLTLYHCCNLGSEVSRGLVQEVGGSNSNDVKICSRGWGLKFQ